MYIREGSNPSFGTRTPQIFGEFLFIFYPSVGLIPATICDTMNIMKTLWDARKKIIGIAAVLLLVLLMMNLNSRLGEYFRLSSERDKLNSEVNDLMLTRVALDTQVAYATSDRAVEDWARIDAHLARPGDKLIIPVTPVDQTPVPVQQVTSTPQPVDNWEIWWALFFGK